jgi:hypothetical protein
MTVKVTVEDGKRVEKTGQDRTGKIPRIVQFYRGKRGKTGGGADRVRTGDLLTASQALSQLSYSPTRVELYYRKNVLPSR